jgi:glucosamine--fructose-6-phosphate aminotransferase (isomerizing)
VKTSRLAVEADYTLFTQAFPEVSAATTKAYVCQLVLLYLLGIKVKYLKLLQKKEVTLEFANSIQEHYIQIIKQIPKYMEKILKDHTSVQKLAAILADKTNLLLVGGTEFPTCEEGALKLKEICGVHAEAIPIGELKQGSLALIDQNMYTILISAQVNNTHEISGAAEIKTRGGKLISILSEIEANKILAATSDYIFPVPDLKEGMPFLQPLTIIYIQLLAYYIAVHKGINPDKPRNLARSVVVE